MPDKVIRRIYGRDYRRIWWKYSYDVPGKLSGSSVTLYVHTGLRLFTEKRINERDI